MLATSAPSPLRRRILVEIVRAHLTTCRPENARRVAKALGDALAGLAAGPDASAAVEEVRDASLALFVAVATDGDVRRTRRTALRAIDRLEDRLAEDPRRVARPDDSVLKSASRAGG